MLQREQDLHFQRADSTRTPGWHRRQSRRCTQQLQLSVVTTRHTLIGVSCNVRQAQLSLHHPGHRPALLDESAQVV